MDHPDGQGARRSLPPSRCPGLRRDSEPGSGNNSTLDNLLLPRFLGPMVNSDRAVHNPPAPLGWDEAPDPPLECLRKPSASSIDALMTSAAPKRHSHGGNGLKSTLRGFSNGFSLRQSRSRGSHSLRQSAAEPAGRSPEVKKHHQPGGKPQHPSPVSLQFHPPAPKPSRDPLGQNCLRRSPGGNEMTVNISSDCSAWPA